MGYARGGIPSEPGTAVSIRHAHWLELLELRIEQIPLDAFTVVMSNDEIRQCEDYLRSEWGRRVD